MKLDLSKVEVGKDNESGLRGMFVSCERGVLRGEEIFSVPASFMVNSVRVREMPALSSFLAEFGAFAPLSDPARVLSLFLAFEKAVMKEDSQWKEILLDPLPSESDFGKFVDAWNEEEIESFGDKGVEAMARGVKATISLQFSQMKKLIEEFSERGNSKFVELLKSFTPSLWRWAHWCVESRAFLDRRKIDDIDVVLVPYADMLNHHAFLADSAEFSEEGFRVVATRDLSKGDMVFNNYGRKTNRELLTVYGFVLLDNPWEAVSIAEFLPWNIQEDFWNPLHMKASKFLKGHIPESQTIRLTRAAVPHQGLVSCLRIWMAETEEEMFQVQQARCKAISLSLESRIFQKYHKIVVAKKLSCAAFDLNHPHSLSEMFHRTRRNILETHIVQAEAKSIFFSPRRESK